MTLLLHRLLRFEQLQLRLWGISAPISAPSASSCLQGLGFNSSYSVDLQFVGQIEVGADAAYILELVEGI